MSIVGQSTAVIGGGASPALHLAAGDLYVRSVKLSTVSSIGCQADSGSTLRLDHVLVTGNSGGGIFLNGAAFDIENTTVSGNGPASDGPTTWGGIYVKALPTIGPTILKLLTVQNNNPVGVSCAAAVSGTDVFVSGSTSGVDISTTTSCGFMSCGATSTTCGAQP